MGEGRPQWGLGVSGFGEERRRGCGGEPMTTLCLSELMSSSSPSTLSSGFHLHSVETRQVMFKIFIARGDTQNVTSGVVCCINV